MSELIWLTLAAIAVFLGLLVPANYLLSRLWERDTSNRAGVPTQMISVESFVIQSSTHYPDPGYCPVPQGPKTKVSGFDQLAAA